MKKRTINFISKKVAAKREQLIKEYYGSKLISSQVLKTEEGMYYVSFTVEE